MEPNPGADPTASIGNRKFFRNTLRTAAAIAVLALGGCRITIGNGESAVAPSNNAAATAGFYPCDGNDEVSCFKAEAAMLNRPPASLHATVMTSTVDPQIMAGNGWGLFVDSGSQTYPYQWQTLNPHPHITISVPLAFSKDSGSKGLTDVASGDYDSSYAALVTKAKNAGYTAVDWREGWEFDGDWMPWSSRNNAEAYVAAYRHVHDLIKKLMPDSTFDWCGDRGPAYANTAIWNAAYPGDNYVDSIGMDVYDLAGSSTTQDFINNLLPSLRFQEDFALSHDKAVSYPEWGLTSTDDTEFIRGMYNWFNSLPATGAGFLAYNDYFNQTNNTGATSLNDPQNQTNTNSKNPNSEKLYKELFGQ